MKNKRIIIILSVVVGILLIPLIAMQFNPEVDWGIVDFVVMGILLSGTGLLCEVVLRNFKDSVTRFTLCMVLVFGLILIWLELAVGVFGTPFAGS